MNKVQLILLCIFLAGCVSEGDTRPAPYLKGEALLQQGLEAYQHDNFIQASEKFTAAFVLYQSFANTKGMLLAQLNLIETALAMDDFAQVTTGLARLEKQELEPALQHKLALLEVKLAYQQQNYPLALQKLQPLLIEISPQLPATDAALTLWAMQAQLQLLTQPQLSSTGLALFQQGLSQLVTPSPYYEALLKRLLAQVALNQQDYATAHTVLTQALAYYQAQANRRAIANCLEDLAAIAAAQHLKNQQKQYLLKSLAIWTWLNNEYKHQLLQNQLKNLP